MQTVLNKCFVGLSQTAIGERGVITDVDTTGDRVEGGNVSVLMPPVHS
jgi:hypothetical protein